MARPPRPVMVYDRGGFNPDWIILLFVAGVMILLAREYLLP